MNKMINVLLAVAAAIVFSMPCAAKNVDSNQKYVLYGLRSAGLKLEYYDAGAQNQWWYRTDITRDAVDLLQDFGIQIIGDEQRVGEPGKPFIHIGVHAFERRDPNFIGLYGYSITVSLRETVKLDRDMERTVHAITWTKGAEGTVAKYRLLAMLEFRMMTLIEDLVRDYLEANRYGSRIPELERRISSPPLGRRLEYDETIINASPSVYKCD